MTLFDRLREAAADPWRDYCHHPFVAGLADGSLPKAAFQHYLTQDYLFLIQFARAYALVAFKADTLEDMRAAATTMSALIHTEMRLHVEYCAGWGLDETAMAAAPEAMETTAYTRFVLDCGQRGDLLDLLVALVPCVVGYGEIGARLGSDAATKRNGNPYLPWIEMYAGAEYQEVSEAARTQLDRLGVARGADARFAALAETFAQATRLEIDFWEMGWRVGAS